MTDWRHLPVTDENLRWMHETVRCKCGHDPSYHYDMGGFCMACLDEKGPDEAVCLGFQDAERYER